MYRWIVLALLLCVTVTACAEGPDWSALLQGEFPTAEVVYEAEIGKSEGLIAILREDGRTRAVIVDAGAAGEVRFHVNDQLFPAGAVPDRKDFWLGDNIKQDAHPFLWYTPTEEEAGFYLTLARDVAGVWRISHAEFDDGDSSNACAYTHEGVTAIVYGDTLFPQVRTLVTLDLAFATFDPVEAEAHTRSILNAPAQYQCYGLDCMENGPCREHGIYLPDGANAGIIQ